LPPCRRSAAALVVVGGGAFALSSLDAGFSEFMRTAAVKVRAGSRRLRAPPPGGTRPRAHKCTVRS
jgi:hypothetical protein